MYIWSKYMYIFERLVRHTVSYLDQAYLEAMLSSVIG